MNEPRLEESAVYCVEPDAGPVHRYQGGDYGIEDIPELFQLGRIEAHASGQERLVITAREIRELKVLADAYSFDFEPGMIELCLDLHRFAIQRREDRFTFAAEF